MRLRVLSLVVTLWLMWGQVSGATRVTPLDDPIFGISYQSDKVRYELMPARIRQLCPDFKRGEFWTFAQFRSGTSEYFIVMGVRPGQDGDSLGAALQIDGSKCQAEDSTWMLSGTLPENGYSYPATAAHLPGLGAPKACPHGPAGDCFYLLRSAAEEAILRGLVKDGIERAIKAYGNQALFGKKACAPSQLTGGESTPVVLQELKRFCDNSP
jgi:hypothetical protein